MRARTLGLGLTLGLTVAGLAGPALADPAPARDADKLVSDDCARARKLGQDCVLTLEAHEVGGDTPRATGTTITSLPRAQHGSLIRIRRDFVREIVKSAEDL